MAVSLYTKLHKKILDSSIWDESHATRIVWVTVLAMADETGHVTASHKALARRAVVTPDELAQALAVLEGPDPHSTSPEEDGRRMVPVQGGWFLVNYAQHRAKETDRNVQNADRQRRYREKQKAGTVTHNNARNVTRNARNVTRNARNVTERHGALLSPIDRDRVKEKEKGKGKGEHARPAKRAATPCPGAVEVAQDLYNAIKAHTPGFMARAQPAAIERRLTAWANDIDRGMRIDGHTRDGCLSAINTAHRSADTFWHSNLLSGKALRKQYERLQIRQGGRPASSAPTVDEDKLDATIDFLWPDGVPGQGGDGE